MNSVVENKIEIIKILESANAENIERIKYIEDILISKDRELSDLQSKISTLELELKNKPLYVECTLKSLIKNKWAKIINIVRALPMDIVYAFELLKREGIKSFVHRTFWYLKGQRLIEDIQEEKNSRYVLKDKIEKDK